MPRFDHLKGVFGLLPTPYNDDYTIHTADLRAAADFCCRSGQHGIVWPVMVGEFYFLGEEERIRHLDVVLEEVNGRLPVVFGCSGVSVPQVLLFARAAERAGADAIIAMAPVRTDAAIAMELFRRLADAYHGPIILQNAATYAPLTGEQIVRLIEEVPQIEYVKEERPPGPRHIAEVHALVGDRVKTIFGGFGGKVLPDELRRGANGCMPACEVADLLAKVMNLWWAGDEDGARDLHRRLLPLIIRETHPFMRYILKRRGVFTSTVERAPAGADALDDDDKREISILLKAIEGDVESFPFGPE
ncbi:MAG: dihydrodipicolinate synthase family protein [Herpetosiphonaceae bacterium]|nr:dihydrodipicolinate synthase family protein [Herpetosiphonaceae bacterium]